MSGGVQRPDPGGEVAISRRTITKECASKCALAR
jgi:hypothetical protein